MSHEKGGDEEGFRRIHGLQKKQKGRGEFRMKFMKRFIVLVLGSILIVGGAGILFASGGNESPGAKGTVSGNWGNINWQQFKGKQLNVLATAMPVSETYKKHLP